VFHSKVNQTMPPKRTISSISSNSANQDNPQIVEAPNRALVYYLAKLNRFDWGRFSESTKVEELQWSKGFFALKLWINDSDVSALSSPSKIDELWHKFILHTKTYRSFQDRMGTIIEYVLDRKSEEPLHQKQCQ
jgi:hypothetical protein